MRVVVELSKEEMESYKNAMCLGIGNSAMRKIVNGTPLPKGHGRIGDLDKVANAIYKLAERMRDTNQNADAINGLMGGWAFVYEAETIIEADKKEEQMPKSCKCILDTMVHKGAMTEKERDKILRNLKTEWIPVTERLPEENGRYLVTRGTKACGAMWNRIYIANYSDLMGIIRERIWWQGNVGKSDFERFDDVIAWMPLPIRYEEGAEK